MCVYIYVCVCVCVCVYIYIYIYIYCDESAASPLIISISPSLNRHPSPGSRQEWVCERRGAETGVWWGTHLKWMEPHHRRCYMPSAPLLWRPVSSPCMHAGVLVGPGRERWGNGCRRRRELPDPPDPPDPWSGRGPHPRDGWRARIPGRTIPRSAAGRRRMKPLHEAAAPRAPDPPGECVRPPDSAPYLDPSFLNTAHPSQTSQPDEDTRSLVYFGHFNPFRHFVLLFLFNKSLSEAWRHTHCVRRLLLLPQYIYIYIYIEREREREKQISIL